ncbi:hypothetical protein DRN86_01425 [Candidatus Geothermarchaeota archaeon]|nr:MAG: hypothetical protein DRN86_01425 [Candidatus Geothermarchaeota archaeon]
MKVAFDISEEDVETVIKYPLSMVASDAFSIDEIFEDQPLPHPRHYGCFPRVLGRYVRERNILSLVDAIRKMGLIDRGVIREEAWTDLVIFDPRIISNRATFENPVLTPTGIKYVIINGKIALKDEARTEALSGRVLRRQVAA